MSGHKSPYYALTTCTLTENCINRTQTATGIIQFELTPQLYKRFTYYWGKHAGLTGYTESVILGFSHLGVPPTANLAKAFHTTL